MLIADPLFTPYPIILKREDKIDKAMCIIIDFILQLRNKNNFRIA